MNKPLKAISLLLILLLSLALFAGCNIPVEKEPLPVNEQLDLLLNALQNNTQKIYGTFIKEGQNPQNIDGIISKSNLRLKTDINETSYYYSGKVLLKNSSGKYFVENPDTTLAEQKNLIPYNLLYFTYSDSNSDNIFMGNNTIGISFVKKGAVNSFSSNMDVNDGFLSIYFADNKIINSVFTAKDAAGKKIVASYNYEQTEYSWDNTPRVYPSDTVNYAKYLITLLSQKYNGYTIHDKNNHNTTAKVSDIPTDKIKTVTSVDITDQSKYYSLSITYTSKVMIGMLNNNVTTVIINYDIDYNVTTIRVNTTDYILKNPLA